MLYLYCSSYYLVRLGRENAWVVTEINCMEGRGEIIEIAGVRSIWETHCTESSSAALVAHYAELCFKPVWWTDCELRYRNPTSLYKLKTNNYLMWKSYEDGSFKVVGCTFI